MGLKIFSVITFVAISPYNINDNDIVSLFNGVYIK